LFKTVGFEKATQRKRRRRRNPRRKRPNNPILLALDCLNFSQVGFILRESSSLTRMSKFFCYMRLIYITSDAAFDQQFLPVDF